MTWPTVPVVTTNVDATTDDPELAVVQIKDAFDKLNQLIAHVSTFVATVLDDADAAAVRATLGLGTGNSPTFTTLTASTSVVTPAVKASAAAGLTLGGNNTLSWQIYDGDTQVLYPTTNNTQDLGRGAFMLRTGYFGTSLISTILDSGSTGSLSLKTNNGTTQLELVHAAGANHATITSGTNPTISTTAGSLAITPTIVATAGQIAFPATQNASADANTLDDYEEGTWTPTLGGTTTMATQFGRYTKVGNIVNFWGRIVITTNGTGNAISGLPFSSDATGDYRSVVNVEILNGATATVGEHGVISSGTTTILPFIKTGAATTWASLVAGNLANGTTLHFSGSYKV